jgi:predicted permease
MWYRMLLRLYPARFRRRHGEEMARLYGELARATRAQGWTARVSFALRLVRDLLRSVVAEHVRAFRMRSLPRSESMVSRWFRVAVIAVIQDVRFATRAYLRTPAFTLAALVTIAIGIGGVTTMFGVVDAVLLRPLPYPGEGTLVQVGLRFGDVESGSTAPADYHDLLERSRTLESVAVSRLQWMDATGEAGPERLDAAGVSHAFFEVLGVLPAQGQGFRPEDDHRSGDAAVVLSHGLWQQRYGGARDVLGRTITLNDAPYTIIGVMPAGFHGPEAIYHAAVELWFPLGRIADPLDQRGDAFMQMIARVRPGMEIAAARVELSAIGERLGEEHPEAGARVFWMQELRERTVRDAGALLWILLGAVALLLVIACVNVANLLLVRAGERTREVAVRSALGAGRGRVARQLLTESALLSLAGGTAGVVLASAGIALFSRFGPADIPRLAEVSLDVRVLGFAIAISLVTGLLFGLMPALQAARSDIVTRLRESGPGVSEGRRGQRARGAFVALQSALAFVLLAGAGLLVNAYFRLATVERGFDVDDVVWVDVDLPGRNYENADARMQFYRQMMGRVRALPGVQAAGAIHGMPLDNNRSLTTMLPEGHVLADPERPPRLPFHPVLPGYFEAMGIALLEGRDVTDDDAAGGPRVAVVSATFAARFWPGERAVGRRFRFSDITSDDSWVTVIGVAGDVRHHGLAEPPEAMVYIPFAQYPRTWVALTVKHDGPAQAVLRSLRETIWALDPTLPLDDFGTMRQRMAGSLGEERFRTWLLAAFAGVALLLTCVGLYGTMAQLVRSRRREMGIRLALGAAARDVRRLVVARGMAITALGLALGITAALVATRTIAAFLFGVSATDPLTFIAGTLLLGGVAFLACWVPACRAGAVDPARTLREE